MEASAQRAGSAGPPAAKPGKTSTRTKSERKLAWMLCAPAVVVMLAVTAYPILRRPHKTRKEAPQKRKMRVPGSQGKIGNGSYYLENREHQENEKKQCKGK